MTFNKIIFSANLLKDDSLEQASIALEQKGFTIEYIPFGVNINTYLAQIQDLTNTIFIGTTQNECFACKELSLPFALAVWNHKQTPKHLHADFYFRQPFDILNLLTSIADPYKNMKWLSLAMEMQFIAQAGLTYSKNVFDLERFSRLRDMSAEIMSEYTELPIEKVHTLFCNETGYQTPKLDTRSVIFNDDKILLVKELDGRWSLPGGWVDVNQSICDNLKKEALEEAGLHVVPTRLVALHDRNRHNIPLYAYGIIKVFMICEVIDGHFVSNIETSESRYFALDELPPLSVGKNTKEQIELCFAAYKDPNWVPIID